METILLSLFRTILGNEELRPTIFNNSPSSTGRGMKHQLCPHSESCFQYSFQVYYSLFPRQTVFLKNFCDSIYM